ncbi:TrbI/VirB10 family protein [Aliidiomarina quisquiliarum]|uniref:TrbI/VirB10 family protein n=1 Tax=Aliidiomarina quisquiliarum TaxID=2938947 RepID=UPI00208F4D19|nr:TrbI/VirB10 family protein [Aliidiomarina quisquiliarum]MCO4319904.1 hypothetical protein [Aliidiomarina quisquiliarum]
MERIKDFLSDNPKVRIGLIFGVIAILIIYIAHKMNESEQRSNEMRIEQRQNERAEPISFFGAQSEVARMDEAQAQDLVSTLNQRMAEKESELDAREERQRHEVSQLREELAEVMAEIARLRSASTPPKNQRDGYVVEGSARPSSPQPSMEEERRLSAQHQPQQVRRQQSEIITESPQRTGRVIRTITQRSIREVNTSGEINEHDIPESRILTERRLQAEREEEEVGEKRRLRQQEEAEFTLAMGSLISGTTLNGVAAPTAVGRSDQPIPVLMRIKQMAAMPNFFTLDIRDCHILGSSIGDLASSRVYIRAEGISCITKDGRAIERNITAYAVSSKDGMAGVEGEVVTRSGEMLVNTMQAGFLSGFAQAATPQRVQPINTDPSTRTLYQTENLDRMAGSGMLTGASNALDKVADYYMTMADAMWPVVEILPGVQIDFIVQRGMTMQLGAPEGEEEHYYD